MAFQVPEGSSRGIPQALVPLIDGSVAAFEKQLRAELGMFAHALNVGKWVGNFRAEVTRVALASFDCGALSTGSASADVRHKA